MTTPQAPIVGTQTGTAQTVYDTGTVTAAISNLPVASYSYGGSDTPATVAAGLAAAINKADSGSATASVVTTIYGTPAVQVSSKATGYINWPIVMSTTYNTSSFTKPSFGKNTTTNVAGGYPAIAAITGSGAYTEFVYSPAGDKIAVVQNGALVKGTVPLPGGASAIYSSAGLKYFRHKDWLGSSRLATTWGHTAYSKTAYAPFGESYNQAGTTDLSFTGEDQDTSAGVYDFEFRKYDSTAGRWMSADPAGLGVVDLTDPQTLDSYTYARNSPVVYVDPNGEDYTICNFGDASVQSSCYTYTDQEWQSQFPGIQGPGAVPCQDYVCAQITYTPPNDGSGQSGSNPGSTAPNNTAARLACAAKYGQSHSIGAAFGGGTVANFLGGNAVSSLLNLGLAATGNGPSPDPGKTVASGPFFGVPVNDALRLAGRPTIQGAGSLSGTARSAGLTGIFNAATESGGIASIAADGGEIAVQGGLEAAEFASGVGLAKFGFDALTVGYGYFFGCPK